MVMQRKVEKATKRVQEDKGQIERDWTRENKGGGVAFL